MSRAIVKYTWLSGLFLFCGITGLRAETLAVSGLVVNPDGSVATVVLNRTEAPIRFELRCDGAAQVVELPPRSIATCIT